MLWLREPPGLCTFGDQVCALSVIAHKRVVPERGFGFITGEDGQEYFFHRTGLISSLSIETLTSHQRVSFEVESTDKGPRASQIRSA